jgi:hypothetical protein
MKSMHTTRALLFLTLLASATAQQNHYDALKNALALTESQISEIKRASYPWRTARTRRYKDRLEGALNNPTLDTSQRAKLAEIVKVLDRWKMVSESIAAGLIDPRQWPGVTLCVFPIRAFPAELALSGSQVSRLEELERTAPFRLINTGDLKPFPSPEAARQRRNLALAILNDAQKSKLAAFELDLKIVQEAIALKLIPDPPKGEILCP